MRGKVGKNKEATWVELFIGNQFKIENSIIAVYFQDGPHPHGTFINIFLWINFIAIMQLWYTTCTNWIVTGTRTGHSAKNSSKFTQDKRDSANEKSTGFWVNYTNPFTLSELFDAFRLRNKWN